MIEKPRPLPGPTEVLVRVHAAGVNPTDWKTRARGSFYNNESPPFTLGFDVAGVVEAVGPGVTIHAPGDEVFGLPRFPRPAGAYAEYVTAPARHFAPLPDGLEMTQAAAIPLAGLTAWQALVDTAGLQAGQRVLVHAAAGGVGHLAVQIAKARGAHVLGTARSEKHDFLRSLGVDVPIDYTSVEIAEAAQDVDVVLDTLGGETTAASLACLRPGGILVRIIPPADGDERTLPSRSDARLVWMLVEPDLAGLLELRELIGSGKLRVHLDRVFDLADAGEAHRYGEEGRTTGKLVLTVG